MTQSSTPKPVPQRSTLVYFHQIVSPLLQYRADVHSQGGEDGIIARLMEVLRPKNRLCVEFGAWDGKLFSNCHNLLKGGEWSGVMIEANAAKFKELQATYAGNPRVASLNRFVDFEGANTLDNILAELSAPEDPALVSIDIDGNDYYIFESMVRLKPEVVVIEFNPTIPNDVLFIQERNPNVNQGCSLLALIALGKKKGYELAVCTGWNAFFVRQDKYHLLDIANNSIHNLYRPVQDGRIFQGYDGSIHVVGMDKLVWKGGLPVSSEDFQVLPKAARFWIDAQREKK